MMSIDKQDLAYLIIDEESAIKISDKHEIFACLSAPEDIFSLSDSEREDVTEIIGAEKLLTIEEKASNISFLKGFIEKLTDENTEYVTFASNDYPEKLRYIPEPPLVLYYRGNLALTSESLVLISGTRNLTAYGADMTRRFVNSFVDNSLTILTGISDGTDATAIKQTLEIAGKSVVVTAGGIDKISPVENAKLTKDVQTTGLVLSEFRANEAPQKFHYVMRNRILAALCDVAILVEAGKESNSVGVIKLANDFGKECFAIPGNLTSKQSHFPNELIAYDEARALVNPKQVVEIFTSEFTFSAKPERILSVEENNVLEFLADGEKHFDEIMEKFQFTSGELIAKLIILEAKKYIKKQAGNVFRKID